MSVFWWLDLPQINIKALLATMYKNNSGLSDKTKLSKFKKGLCLTEKLVY